MIGITFFWLFFLSAVTTMFSAGRAVERRFALFLFGGVVATYLLNTFLGWDGAHFLVMLINIVVLAYGILLISAVARFWPIWFSAFHSITVATDVAQMVFPNNVPALYTNLQGFWFFPAVVSMVVGVVLDSRSKNHVATPA